jgi:hypothetical protein
MENTLQCIFVLFQCLIAANENGSSLLPRNGSPAQERLTAGICLSLVKFCFKELATSSPLPMPLRHLHVVGAQAATL